MQALPIGHGVNNTRNQGRELIEPAGVPLQ